jgi:hypothetical protein
MRHGRDRCAIGYADARRAGRRCHHPAGGSASLTSRQLVTPGSELCNARQAGRPATKRRPREVATRAPGDWRGSDGRLDDSRRYACASIRPDGAGVAAGVRLGSGPERRERGSHCRSSRNPRYSVGRPTFFGHTVGVWSPTPTPLPCARRAGHGQASLRMATGARDGRPARRRLVMEGCPSPLFRLSLPREYGLPGFTDHAAAAIVFLECGPSAKPPIQGAGDDRFRTCRSARAEVCDPGAGSSKERRDRSHAALEH